LNKKLSCLPVLGLAALLMPAAHADLTSTLTTGAISGTPFGTVTVTSINADEVKVTLTLTAGDVFAVTGSGSPFGYDLDSAAAGATLVAGSLTAGFSLTGSNGFADGIGTFPETVSCSICGPGTSGKVSGPLTFELSDASGITSNDFVKDPAGYYFGADVGVPKGGGTFSTGPVGASTVKTTSAVPEPGSVFLFGTILGGLVLTLRKRLSASFRHAG
jgi:hypothetical protein